MERYLGFWIVFGVAAFGLLLAVQMRMMISKVLCMSVAATHTSIHRADIRTIVRASVAEVAPVSLPKNLGAIRDWVRAQHPGAVANLARARRSSAILAVVLLVTTVTGRFVLEVI